MGKRELQKSIRKEQGYLISTDTLNLNHLLATAYDVLTVWNMNAKDLKKEILEEYGLKNFSGNLYMEVYRGRKLVDPDRYGWNAYNVWDEVENYFNKISPNGYYFGSCPSDGALIGWFKWEDEGEEF